MKISPEIIERYRKTEPATYGHFPGVNFMDSGIKPVSKHTRMAGQAYTLRLPSNDSAMLYKALKEAEEGSVLVIDRVGDTNFAPVGEMIVRNAYARKLAGIVVDGAITDFLALEEIGLPVFYRTVSVATTSVWGIIGERQIDIQCGGAVVRPGDLILGNVDGVVVLPPMEDLTLLEKAEKIEQREVIMREKFAQGIDQLLDVDQLLEANIMEIIQTEKEKGRK